jgi:FixJ family two-component response regulator
MNIAPRIAYVVGLALLFRAVGLQSQSFSEGRAFLEAYPKLRPGCLFVDLAMRGMSGLDLLRQLRAAGCRWPIVILTGQGSTVSAEGAMRVGAFAFLEKPIKIRT